MRRLSDLFFLIFDVGTTGAKTLLFDEHGTIIGKAYQEYAFITPSQMEIEQNPNDWWDAIKTTTIRVLSKTGIDAEKIKAISLTTQRSTVVPIDKNGNPLYNAITWLDSRPIELPEEFKESLLQRTLTQKILWFKKNRPSVCEETYKFASVDSFFTKKLVDRILITPSTAAYYPYSVSSLDWDEELITGLGLDIDKFPEVVSSGEVIGELSKEAAEELELPENISVIMGAGDQQASAVGLGVIKQSMVKATTGTGTFVNVVVEEPYFEFYEPTTHMFILPFIGSDKWILEGVLPGTGAMLRWYRDNFALDAIELAKKENKDPYDIIIERAAQVVPGSEGLLVVPMFSFGRGAFQNLSFAHTKNHLVRAILESNGYGIRFFLDMMADSFELELEDLRIDGGGAKSNVWNQILADITKKKVLRTKVIEDAGALGAAILASVGADVYSNLEKAISEMVRVDKEYIPNEETFETYDELYDSFQELMLSAAAGLEI